MLEFMKRELNRTFTENGAVTNRSTGKECLDLFASIGALRRESETEITARFLRAYAENPDLAMKIAFYGRDVRGGLGERRVFRAILRWLAFNERTSVIRNLPFIAEYGRWDDLLVLLDTPCRAEALAQLKSQFDADMAALSRGEAVSLLGKWLPSVNASSAETVRLARLIARAFGLSDRRYRKALTALRGRIRILENNLREKDYSFDYSRQPSRAMFKYRQAFIRNDLRRYGDFIEQVRLGKAVLHTDALFPYEIVTPFFTRVVSAQERAAIDATWNAQRDFTTGENALVVIDGSGSMYSGGDPVPAAVALSLGVYFAERNTGAFRNHFITFSANPQLVEIKGGDIYEKIRYCHDFNEVANTNIQKVFALILNAAVRNKVPQKELPATVYIISDMEFDSCAADASLTNFEYARRLYARMGYALPRLVFWNVASRNRQQPVTVNDRGVALVSGCSPRIFSMVMDGLLDPYSYMLSIVDTERYAPIAA